ncbi:MAG: thermonuclease family protein [Elusimicrobia bacterium]|nr:thermonuclease family protein [Elusimicrobiota bacterium]
MSLLRAAGCAIVLAASFASAAEPRPLSQLRDLAALGADLPPQAPAVPQPAEPKPIRWEDAAEHVGEPVIVEGMIVASFANSKVCFLNFSQEYKANLTLVIFASAYDRFIPGPDVYYRDKVVQATGIVKRSERGNLELVLNGPEQLRVLSEGPPTILYWEDVTAEHAGKVVTVEGPIEEVRVSEKVAFINFHRNWTRYVAGVIFGPAIARFPASLEGAYLRQQVRMTGIVRLYEGRPEIVLHGPSQLQVVRPTGPDAVRAVDIVKSRLRVDDGDTVFYEFCSHDGITDGAGRSYSGELRLLGFDTPEVLHPEHGIFYDQPYGGEATRFAESLIRGAQRVQFVTTGQKDPYGRLLGHLALDGELLAVSMLRAGFAYEMITPYGDNGFPAQAARILKAWNEDSPIQRALRSGQEAPFQHPTSWRRLHQAKDLALSREAWTALGKKGQKELAAKAREQARRREQPSTP